MLVAAETYRQAFAQQARSVLAVLQTEIARYRASRIGYIVYLAQPIVHILVLYCAFWFLMRRTGVHLGTSVLLFLATGFIPYHLFTNISTGVARYRRAYRRFEGLAVVKPIDVVYAHSIFEAVSMMLAGTIVFGGLFVAFDVNEAVPSGIPNVVHSVLALSIFAVGFGLCEAIAAQLIGFWPVLRFVLRRGIFLTSGIFYLVDSLTPEIRQYLLWNPVLHGVEWFRQAFYPSYPALGLSKTYLLGSGLVLLVFGLLLDRAMRARLRVK